MTRTEEEIVPAALVRMALAAPAVALGVVEVNPGAAVVEKVDVGLDVKNDVASPLGAGVHDATIATNTMRAVAVRAACAIAAAYPGDNKHGPSEAGPVR
ncbi:MAG: hypothetical protein ACRDF9_00835 [Candidatus Limnocylindria bacterium]